ncbi:MFS transporter [Aureibacillus halotolerans]|uniref:Nucleoside transporter n=1 Tax=Aureibacillus halotolerans TaxID=1508390 RepID=A0A4R6TYC9_9BACI|nr:MFS transporter [Aureibacillus halotolerans]TDQ38326.1 nucleoside transporter [Aureibacillus halotolerans]
MPSMKQWMTIRLCTMMFLELFIRGSWYVTAGLVLSTHGLGQYIGLVYSFGALAAMLSPIMMGMLVDRFFPSQKVLSCLHLCGGLLLLVVPGLIEGQAGTWFTVVIFVYMLLSMPGQALTNSVSFQNMSDARQFPFVRSFGTLGWVVAGLVVGRLGLSFDTTIFLIAGIASLVYSVYTLTLPHTPPPAKGKPFSFQDLLFKDAWRLLADRPFRVFVIASVLISVPMGFYYSFSSPFLGVAEVNAVSSVMSIGQMTEFVFMLLVPFFLRRLGFKRMFIIGIFAWCLRYLVFALGALVGMDALLVGGVALHGVCFNFCFVIGFMYAQEKAPTHAKGQAQTLVVFATQGIGVFLGASLGGLLYGAFSNADGILSISQWPLFWMIPAGIALLSAIYFIVGFREKEAVMEKRSLQG